MKQTTLELETVEEEEIGTLDTLPTAITFCLENHAEVKNPEIYAKETTIKIGEITLAKNAP